MSISIFLSYLVSQIELVHCPTSGPYGITLPEWTVMWWRWLLSIPKEMNPANDYSGHNASMGQTNPHVFFLCQTIEGVKSPPFRKITISRGRSVFMPLINWISTLHTDGETDEDLIRVAKEKMDSIKNLEFVINEQPYLLDLKKLRHNSGMFQVVLPKDNILDVAPGITRCSSDGYWLFFNIKEHSLRLDTFGSCSSGITKIGVSYNISIED